MEARINSIMQLSNIENDSVMSEYNVPHIPQFESRLKHELSMESAKESYDLMSCLRSKTL